MERNDAPTPKPNEHANAALFRQAFSLHQQGKVGQAKEIYQKILEKQPKHFDALHLLGLIALQTNDPKRAVDLIGQALEIDPNVSAAYCNHGNALQELKQYHAALRNYDKAIALNPNYADAYNNRGNALSNLKQYASALQSYDRAIALKPDHPDFHYHRGIALRELKQYVAALQSYERAIALNPKFAEAYNHRGIVLRMLNRHDAALLSYDKAIGLNPDYAEAHSNRGKVLQTIGQYEEAMSSYGKALSLKPHLDFLYGTWLHTKLLISNWKDVDNAIAKMVESIERGESSASPFAVLGMSHSPAIQRKAAEIFVRKAQPDYVLPQLSSLTKRDKIHIGYFSAHFYNHATSYLIAELIERHDKSRFELSALSFGPRTADEMQLRLSASADRFIDVSLQSDREVAMLARNLQIDIAVDLNGLTQDNRFGIFALRAAPVQVNYLAYAGTMGADCIDYLIANSTLIREMDQQYYVEKIVYLPDSYQVSDSTRRIAGRQFTRIELGLPPTGFVFCCFNSSHKILPEVFDSWMHIMRQVEDSALWLLREDEATARNLRQEAEARGVSASRLIFAERMPLAEHLARHRLADLFLDTLPFNAHTTASDALWSGLPLLTRIGDTFAGRVGASLLRAIDLPELITSTRNEYEELAIALATNPSRHAQIRQKLERNRLTTPLFNTSMITRYIEDAYVLMYERQRQGLRPTNLWPRPLAYRS